MTALAELLQRQGRHDEAAAAAEKAVDISTKILPKGHWRRGDHLILYGAILLEQGRQQESEKYLTEGVRILQVCLGDPAPKTQKGLRDLVDLYEATGRPERAQEYRSLLLLTSKGPPEE